MSIFYINTFIRTICISYNLDKPDEDEAPNDSEKKTSGKKVGRPKKSDSDKRKMSKTKKSPEKYNIF